MNFTVLDKERCDVMDNSKSPYAPFVDEKKFVLLHEKDNVLVCCSPVKDGEVVVVEGLELTVSSDVGVGHKIAINWILHGSDGK